MSERKEQTMTTDTLTTTQVARRIARNVNASAGFAGALQLVYDRRTGERVGSFAGSPVYVTQWSLWDGDTMICVRGGNGERVTIALVEEMLRGSSDDDYGYGHPGWED